MAGPDIFLSYNREDADRARQFAEGFAAQGLDVWWDVALRSGEAYDEVTEAALRGAKAVVVLWSTKSVVSRWVRAEATLAERKKTLMPAMIEACERPIMFELTQTADLSHWQGDTADKGWKDFARHVCEFVGKEAPARPAAAEADAALPRLDQISIVVLPFTNMGGDPEQDYFADGMTEDIITDLSKVSALKIIARNTAFTFKGKHVDVADVTRQLNVTHVLEGSVRKAGNRVRVTAQLIDGSDSSHVWAERYDRDLDDIFELQDELSKAIVKALKVKLLPEERKAIGQRGTADTETYDLFMRARALLGQLSPDSLVRAETLLRKAIERDPGFLRAYALLHSVLGYTRIFLPERVDDLQADMAAITQRAAEIAPGDPHVLLMQVQRLLEAKDFWQAVLVLESLPVDFASDLSLTSPAYAAILFGRFEEALPKLREAVRLDPLDRLTSWGYRDLLDCSGRLDEAELEHERSKDLAGDRGFIELCAFLRLKGRATPEAIEAQYRTFLAARMDDMRVPFFDNLILHLRDPEAARASIREAMTDPHFDGPARLIWLALIAGWFDATEEAIEALQRLFAGPTIFVVVLRYIWLPVLRDVRRDPRFKDILREMGLYDYWRRSGKWGDLVRPLGDDDFEVIG